MVRFHTEGHTRCMANDDVALAGVLFHRMAYFQLQEARLLLGWTALS